MTCQHARKTPADAAGASAGCSRPGESASSDRGMSPADQDVMNRNVAAKTTNSTA